MVHTKIVNEEEAIGAATRGVVEESLAIGKPSEGGGRSDRALTYQISSVRIGVPQLIYLVKVTGLELIMALAWMGKKEQGY